MTERPAGEAPFVHPTAIVDDGAVLEPGVRIWHHAHVSAGAVIGAGTSLGQGAYVGPDVRIGAGCKIQNHVSVYAGVTLEDDVFVGPSAVFTNVKNPRAHVSRRHAFLPTRVGTQATIGANATIVCGTTVGARAFVAAGAVVTRDVPTGVLVVGTPAREAGFVCACGERLVLEGTAARCSRCKARWQRADDGGIVLGPEPR